MNTPWGPSQDILEIADGIRFVSTSSHGGYKLSGARDCEVLRRFRTFRPYAGGSWYEEDCDAGVVALTFPAEFDDAALRSAVQTARMLHKWHVENPKQYPERGWTEIVGWLDSSDPQAATIRNRIILFETANAKRWERGSLWGPVKGYPRGSWGVSLRRVSDGTRRTVVFAEYPAQQFYTDSELAALAAQLSGDARRD